MYPLKASSGSAFFWAGGFAACSAKDGFFAPSGIVFPDCFVVSAVVFPSPPDCFF
jgi:hypothetical protein